MAYEFNTTKRLQPQNGGGVEVQRDVLFGVDWRKNRPRPIETDALVYFAGKNGTAFTMTDAMLSRMTLLVGGNGYGKTNVMSFAVRDIRRNLHAEDVMLIFDSKGDNYEKFYRAGNPADIVLGGSPEYERVTKCWNIYDELRNDRGEFDKRSEEQAKELIKQMAEVYQETTQPLFPMAAAEIIAFVIISVVRAARVTGDERQLNNWSLVNFLCAAERKNYEEMISIPGNEDMSAVRSYLGTATDKMSNQGLGVFAYIHKFVNDLFIGILEIRQQHRSRNFPCGNLCRRAEAKHCFWNMISNAASC